jgi:hypothetical protein
MKLKLYWSEKAVRDLNTISVIFSLIDTMLTKKKFKDFFQKNIAAL